MSVDIFPRCPSAGPKAQQPPFDGAVIDGAVARPVICITVEAQPLRARSASRVTRPWNSESQSVATCVHTSAGAWALTSLGLRHLWAGLRRPHIHYAIGDDRMLCSAPPAAGPLAAGTADHGAEPRRSCSARRCSASPARAEDSTGTAGHRAGHGEAARRFATRHHQLRTCQRTRASGGLRELRAGASTSRYYRPRTRMELWAARAGGAA